MTTGVEVGEELRTWKKWARERVQEIWETDRSHAPVEIVRLQVPRGHNPSLPLAN